MRQLPNFITFSRILVIPVTWYLFLREPFDWDTLVWGFPVPHWIIWIVIFAGVTDIIDGWAARKLNVQSTFGILMDPIADKLFVTTCFVFLVYLDRLHPIGVVLAISRDALMNVLRSYASSQGIVISARIWGKIKTVIQFVAIGFLVHSSTLLLLPWIPVLIVGKVLFWTAIGLAYYSLGLYVSAFMKQKKPNKN